ncbi:MAG: hypothetical protein ACR2QC_01415 [Gammaproteobacteria bacterium]
MLDANPSSTEVTQQHGPYGALPDWSSEIDPFDLAARLVGGIVELSIKCGYHRSTMCLMRNGDNVYPRALANLLLLFQGMFTAEQFIQAGYIQRQCWERWCRRYPHRVPANEAKLAVKKAPEPNVSTAAPVSSLPDAIAALVPPEPAPSGLNGGTSQQPPFMPDQPTTR